MQSQVAAVKPPVNRIHRRQVFWQIWLPLILTVIVVLAAAVMAVLSTGSGRPTTGQYAAISTIWLILPLIPAGVIFLLLTTGMVYLTTRALRIIPVYSRLAQIYVQIFGVRVGNLLDRFARPVIQYGGRSAGWKELWKRLTRF